MKKKIYLVFNNREKEITWRSLYEELLMVFEDNVEIKLCFLDEAKAEDLQDGDLYLVLYKDRVYQMKKYISSLDKVVVLTRTFERKYLDDVYALPEGTDVLIVNDGKDSTLQTTNSLYEIGLNHLNLIPYIDTEDYEKYKNIEVAITPGESEYVPDHIKKIIDVQNRCIDANTFVKIINKLGLNNSQVAKNLLSYIQITTESDIGAGKRYINDYLREGILKQAIQEMDYAIIITDKNLDLVYYNDRADIAFALNDKNKSNLRSVFSEEIFNKLAEDEDYKNLLVEIKSANYLVTKMAVEIVDQAVGFCLLGRHIIVALGIPLDHFQGLTGAFAHNGVELFPHTNDMVGGDLDISSLALQTAHQRLMDHDLGIGQCDTLALGTGREQKCAHAGSHTHADGGYVALDVVHGVIDRHARGDRSSGRINIKVDILVGILRLKVEHLCYHERCGNVVYLVGEEYDSVIEKSRINVVGALTA